MDPEASGSLGKLSIEDHKLKKHLKILILGDSITHGGEGDYTWRYRLWQWFKQEHLLYPGDPFDTETGQRSKTLVSFVGPYTGVKGPDPPNIPHPAPLPGEDDAHNHPAVHIDWGYAPDVNLKFKAGSRHFATWGYQAFQCKDTIADVVSDWQPDLILSLLGFNDVGWWVSDADGTLDSLHKIVERTRAVKPDVDFAFGNIVNRTYMEGREDLLDNTKRFNDLLPVKAKEWSKKNSRVVVVDVAKHYDCGPQYRDWAPAAYDGLHPSALGEFQIAQAFSEALHKDFGLGEKTLKVPKDVPKRDLHDPKDIVSKSTPMGINVTWQQVFGAAYEIRHRALGSERNSYEADPDESWNIIHSNCPRIDIETSTGSKLELQIRCTHGFEHGPWSRVWTCSCTHTPIPAPTHVKTRPIRGGFSISWTPPETERVISRYEVLYKDDDRGDAFPSLQGSLGTKSEIKGLPEGDVIQWIMVRGWCLRTKGGEWVDETGIGLDVTKETEWVHGEWGHGRAVRVGGAEDERTIAGNDEALSLARPLNLRIEEPVQDNTVNLAWDHEHSSSAKNIAGFLVYVRALTNKDHVAETDGRVWRDKKADVFCIGGKWNYEFSVSAVNGHLESERSGGVIPEREEVAGSDEEK
ncbi:hypothetical protein CBER1_03012 [Cercospora berteroae]|uniref:SGNH hydrolase-type esterase domain-containing protein n=1 Tax=Cercospora berteroae TaxID=357750 RepID=A0A2S6CHJ3_9PEZI|nr:hypothetical protein CBER1_03012 [Cercospora berteroae]